MRPHHCRDGVIGRTATSAGVLLLAVALIAVGQSSTLAAPSSHVQSPCSIAGPIISTFDDEAQLAVPPPLPQSESGQPLCASNTMMSYGQQTFYDMDNASTSSQSTSPSPRRFIHLWREGTAEGLPSESLDKVPQMLFLAWEKLDIDTDREADSHVHWRSRMEDLMHGAGKHNEVAGVKSAMTRNKRGQQTPLQLLQSVPPISPAPIVHEMHATYAVVEVASIRQLVELSSRLPRDTRIARLAPLRPSLTEERNVTLPVPRFNPALHALLFSDTLSVPNLRQDARALTGEDTELQRIDSVNLSDELLALSKQHWHSRHSATLEARLAAAWIRARMQRDLSPLNAVCHEWEYDAAFSPNVICTIPATATGLTDDTKSGNDEDASALVLFSAHYDSRGTFGSTRAPGGDDDGSGTTMLLALARHLGRHRIAFKRPVRLVAFSGEEQGLVGSQHYARHLRNTSTPVHFQLQTDMIGYRKPGEPLQVAFPDRLATVAATQYVMQVARMYVPELQLGYTPACCSDHQSFWEQGYTSTWLFERRAPIADPCYHDSCDVTEREGYDFDQVRASTRLVLATLLDVAGGVDWPY